MLTPSQTTVTAYEVEGDYYSVVGFELAFPNAVGEAEAYRDERRESTDFGWTQPTLGDALEALGYRAISRFNIDELESGQTEAEIEYLREDYADKHLERWWEADLVDEADLISLINDMVTGDKDAPDVFDAWIWDHSDQLEIGAIYCAQTGERIT